jgi:hypothetical protein
MLRYLDNSNFAIKVSHIFLFDAVWNNVFFLILFAFLKSIRDRNIFSYEFPIDVFHAFTEMGGCVRSPTSLTSVMTKRR